MLQYDLAYIDGQKGRQYKDFICYLFYAIGGLVYKMFVQEIIELIPGETGNDKACRFL